jgi:predicted DNA-binding WGR domain protein
MAKARRFEFTDEKSNKFWEVSVTAATVTVRYGRIGSEGQSQVKTHPSSADAEAAAEKQIQQKTKSGYREVGSGEGAGQSEKPIPKRATAKKAATAPKAGSDKKGGKAAAGRRKATGVPSEIGQFLFGGIVYFADDTHWYVASTEEDETVGSYDEVRNASGKGYGKRDPEFFTINSYTDWYLPTLFELDLMNRYINFEATGKFADDFYWSADTYPDEDGEIGDAVPFKFDPPGSNAPPTDTDFKTDLARLKQYRKHHRPALDLAGVADSGQYSGGSEQYIRLARKEPRP